ncbi:MAG: monovalent cation/H(+) antiporter subunit G [Chloroflexi bacterium]|nr:monovalent cation/H(+) antiporter subunit G [Chloroflexota bacterium]
MILVILAAVLMVSGAFFLTVSCIGLIRLPDVYSRIHAVGKSETLGAILMLGGLAIYNGWTLTTARLLLILLFILLANPAATHAIARSALVSGLEPWTKQKKQTGGNGTAEDESAQQGE